MTQNYSQFNPAGPLTGAEIIPLMQGGVTLRSTATALAAFGQSLLLPPPAAIAAGHTTLLFGPNVTLGANWFPFNLLGVTPNPGQAVQNSNGSVTLGAVADGSGFNGGICTAQKTAGGTSWAGAAFNNGYTVDYVMSFVPTLQAGGGGTLPFPALWARAIDYLAQVGGATQWVGQATGYARSTEWDLMQWPHNSLTLLALSNLIDWYGLPASTSSLILPVNSETTVSIPFNQPFRGTHVYKAATATTQGSITDFINGVQTRYLLGSPIVWNPYNPAAAPPPVAAINGTIDSKNGGSIIDQDGLAFIAGTDTTSQLTLYSFALWGNQSTCVRTGPVPTVSSLVPNLATHGAAQFTLAVNGTNFARLATVFWGSTALTTTYINANQLFAVVPATLIASAGTATVTVQNTAFSISNGQTFVTS